jgi:biopolymer transport protein ExbB
MRILLSILTLGFLVIPLHAEAWWHKDWTQRKRLSLNADAIAGLRNAVAPAVVPIRLHTGNFSFVDALEDGADLRFVAGDDQTPLKFHLEQFDGLNELAVAWVQIPRLAPGAAPETVWLYYGNKKATRGDDPKGTYDAAQRVVLHFAENDAPKDVSAYGSDPVRSNAKLGAAGIVGAAAAFDGTQSMTWPRTPSLNTDPATGVTFSAWLRAGGAQESVVFAQEDANGSVVLGIAGAQLLARVGTGNAKPVELRAGAALGAGAWHHVALVVHEQAILYLDGKPVGQVAAKLPAIAGALVLGAGADGKAGFRGELDAVSIASIARSADWVAVAATSQGAESKLVGFTDSEVADDGSASYFMILLAAVTLDGWIVIAILMVMMVIAIWVMIDKFMFIARARSANAAFREALSMRPVTGPRVGELAAVAAPFASVGAMAVQTDVEPPASQAFPQSSLGRIYDLAHAEVAHRFAGAASQHRLLSAAAISAIKAAMDASMIREYNRLNSGMVLLTIAISGGPFLGLLGTVVGVMITFAAIAAAGDVNVNSIAPGIAAALVATVAGLAVAIPALFGYNYLSSRIREIHSDMQVFADEMVTKIAEQYSN